MSPNQVHFTQDQLEMRALTLFEEAKVSGGVVLYDSPDRRRYIYLQKSLDDNKEEEEECPPCVLITQTIARMMKTYLVPKGVVAYTTLYGKRGSRNGRLVRMETGTTKDGRVKYRFGIAGRDDLVGKWHKTISGAEKSLRKLVVEGKTFAANGLEFFPIPSAHVQDYILKEYASDLILSTVKYAKLHPSFLTQAADIIVHVFQNYPGVVKEYAQVSLASLLVAGLSREHYDKCTTVVETYCDNVGKDHQARLELEKSKGDAYQAAKRQKI